MMKKKVGKAAYAVLALIVLISTTYLVSAGIGNWWKGITGRATSGEANATITLSGTNQVSVRIWNYTLTGSSVSPSEDDFKVLVVNITVEDQDGAADINDSSVALNVSRGSELLKVNNSCVFTGLQTATARNYTCSWNMWYFEESGVWTITARANDYGTQVYVQNTSTFYYASLTAMKMAPTSLTWPGVSPGQTNRTSNNDPLVLNNTGNYPSTNVTVIGINLVGVTVPSYSIDVRNFTVDTETGGGSCSGSACVECAVSPATSGAIMQNNTEIQIMAATLPRGNHSVNDGSTGQEQLYFCMYSVPSNLISQTYTTPDEWTFTIR